MAILATPRPRLLTVEEVAEQFHVSASWVYRHAGELSAIRLGGVLRFDPAEIDRLLEEGRQ